MTKKPRNMRTILTKISAFYRCMCCPRSDVQTEDARLRAILERLDDMENKMTEMTSFSQGGSLTESTKQKEEEHAPFSKQDVLMDSGERCM